MPPWPRPRDIWFDHAAAEEAVLAVAAMRFVLEASWVAESDAGAGALDAWQGMAAHAFHTSLRARGNLTRDIGVDLRRLQAAIENAIDDAVEEQWRIDELQADWDDRSRREQLAAAEAATETASGGAR